VKHSPAKINPEMFERYLHAGAQTYQVSPGLLRSRNRTGPVAEARMMVMYFLRPAGCRLVEIGEAFRRDHSSVIYAHKQIRAWMLNNEAVRQKHLIMAALLRTAVSQ